jgi:hypothetical protein
LTSDPPATFRLTDLPNEIIREICIRPELKKNDLRALRLTSKHLCQIALQRFVKECFRSITVLMSRPSLEAFIALSQHPYFGSFVDKINVSPVYSAKLRSPATLLPSTSGGTGSIEIASTYLNTNRNPCELRACESAEQLLSVAFEAFAQRGQCLKLQFCNDESNAIAARGPIYNEADEGISFWELDWELDWTTTMERTVKAVISRGCTVTELSIEESGPQRCVPSSGLCTDKIEPQLGSLCSQLARLEICYYDDGVEHTSRSMRCMVSTAQNLKSLNLMRLCNWGDLDPHIYPEVLGCVLSTCLETIVIGEFQISQQELLAFLGRQTSTLRDLQLLGGCVFAGSCMSLIAWIKDNLPGLVYLELWEICDNPDFETCNGDTKSYCVRRGNDMQACLADILDGKYEKGVKVEEVDGSEQAEEDVASEHVEEDDV